MVISYEQILAHGGIISGPLQQQVLTTIKNTL